MAREPSRRYATMEAMADDLRAYLEDRVVRAHRTGALAEFAKWTRRNRGTAAALAAVLVVLVGGAVAFATLERANAERERDLAHQLAGEKATAERALAAEQEALALAKAETEKATHEAAVRGLTLEWMQTMFRAARPGYAERSGQYTMRQFLEGARSNLDKIESMSVTGLEEQDDEAVGQLQGVVAMTHHSLGEYELAAELFADAVRNLEASLGAGHGETINHRRSLANSLLASNQVDEAIEVARRALDDARGYLGENTPLTIWAMSDLGIALKLRGRFDEGDDRVGVALVDGGHPLRAADDRQEVDVGRAGLGQHVERVDRAAAGCEHRVDQQDLPLTDAVGQLLVVLDRAVGLRIPVEPEVADLPGRDQGEDRLDHHEPGPQDADDGGLRAGKQRRAGGRDRGLDLDRLGGEVAEGLVGGEERDLLAQGPEGRRLRALVAQHRDLVGDEWVVDDVQRSAHDRGAYAARPARASGRRPITAGASARGGRPRPGGPGPTPAPCRRPPP